MKTCSTCLHPYRAADDQQRCRKSGNTIGGEMRVLITAVKGCKSHVPADQSKQEVRNGCRC